MTKTDDQKFDETLRRLMSAPPKPQDEMKKGRETNPAPSAKSKAD